jgi:hypothetical protein
MYVKMLRFSEILKGVHLWTSNAATTANRECCYRLRPAKCTSSWCLRDQNREQEVNPVRITVERLLRATESSVRWALCIYLLVKATGA